MHCRLAVAAFLALSLSAPLAAQVTSHSIALSSPPGGGTYQSTPTPVLITPEAGGTGILRVSFSPVIANGEIAHPYTALHAVITDRRGTFRVMSPAFKRTWETPIHIDLPLTVAGANEPMPGQYAFLTHIVGMKIEGMTTVMEQLSGTHRDFQVLVRDPVLDETPTIATPVVPLAPIAIDEPASFAVEFADQDGVTAGSHTVVWTSSMNPGTPIASTSIVALSATTGRAEVTLSFALADAHTVTATVSDGNTGASATGLVSVYDPDSGTSGHGKVEFLDQSTLTVRKGSFNFSVRFRSNAQGVPDGRVTYSDKANDIDFTSTSLTSLLVRTVGGVTQATVTGQGRNGRNGTIVPFTLKTVDAEVSPGSQDSLEFVVPGLLEIPASTPTQGDIKIQGAGSNG